MGQKISAKAQMVLTFLRDHAESDSQHEDGSWWGGVYLGNARHAAEKAGITPKSFTGYLSSLTKAGLYEKYDGDDAYWGYVKLEKSLDEINKEKKKTSKKK